MSSISGTPSAFGLVETGLLALGLSLDSFAAAVGRGAHAGARRRLTRAVGVAGLFGGFHFTMPILGWLAGVAAKDAIAALDHWVAFVLLAAVGAGMIRSGAAARKSAAVEVPVFGFLALFALAMATSVDAAIVGTSVGVMARPILATAAAIAAVTFAMSLAGSLLGRAAGAALGPRAEIAGGLLLIGLGAKIVVSHTLAA